MLVREEDTNTTALNSTIDIALILLLLLWNAEDTCATAAGSPSQGMRNLPPSLVCFMCDSQFGNWHDAGKNGNFYPNLVDLSSHNVLYCGMQQGHKLLGEMQHRR